MNRNSRIEVRITLTEGTTWVEKYRNSFGSYCKMLDRVADRIDGTDRPEQVEVHGDGHATYTTRGGATFTTGDVLTEADRVAV